MHPPDKKPEPPSNTEAALAGCFVGSVGLVVLTVFLVCVTVIAVVVVASCPAQTASATEQREIRIELTREYSGSVSVLLKGSGGWPAGERQGLVFESMAFGADTWEVAYVQREVPVWQEGGSYRSSPVPVALTVLRNSAGEFYVSVRGELLPVQFNPRQRCGGQCAAEWEGTFTVPAPEHVALATPTPSPTPTPIPLEQLRVKITLRPSGTTVPGVEGTYQFNHDTERVSINGFVHGFVSSGEEYDLDWKRGTMENMRVPEMRTLRGGEVLYWACAETDRDYRIQFECSVERTESLPDLSEVEEATFWYYITDENNWPRAYLLMEREWRGSFDVAVRFHDYPYYIVYHLFQDRPRVGVIKKMGGGGGINSPHVTHTNVSSVTGRDAVYCQHHTDSDEERSVWACEPW